VIETARPSARRRTRRPRSRRLLVAAGLLLAFAVGIALGQALADNPVPGGTQTQVRTLHPQQLAPAARSTVTITVSAP